MFGDSRLPCVIDGVYRLKIAWLGSYDVNVFNWDCLHRQMNSQQTKRNNDIEIGLEKDWMSNYNNRILIGN